MKIKPFIKPLMIALTIAFTACDDHDDDDDHKHNEEEMINQVQLTLSNDSTQQIVTWSDLDGDGGNDPILPDTLYFLADSTYTAQLEFFHVHDGETESINPEIKDESDDHLICFTPTNMATVITMEVTPEDTDENGLPVGLLSTWKAVSPFSTNMKITLKHQSGTKNGQCDIGETDVEVEFPFVIK